MKFDHIGVAARTLGLGRSTFEEVLGIRAWSREFEDPANGIYCQFGYDASGICYEIVAPFGENSPIADAVRTRNRILNHVAYLVADIAGESLRLRSSGCVAVTQPTPAVAYGGARVQFFLTKLRFIIELIESPDHTHEIVGTGKIPPV